MNCDSKAKVFISCGQNKASDEAAIASDIAARLRVLGFDPYVATEEQTLLGIRENVFRHLQDSEYFVFVDFCREPLGATLPIVHRGSLFSHQELAVASYLELPVLLFQESGVKPQDGLGGFLQANSCWFSDRSSLAAHVAATVVDNNWRTDWKNALCIERDDALHVDAFRTPENLNARFFHVKVRNRNPWKPARNCYVYLDSAIHEATGQAIPLETVEFKWAGYVLPNAQIQPGSFRVFDALWVPHDLPYQPRFNTYADSSRYVPSIVGPGSFRLRFTVSSDNFPSTHADLSLTLGRNLADTSLTRVP